MRQDKLTTKFQEALSDAQSLALGRDHGYIEPLHLLAAMLHQEDGPGALLQRSGVNLPGLQTATEAAIKKLPQVQGQDQIQISPDLAKLLQATEKEALKRADARIREDQHMPEQHGAVLRPEVEMAEPQLRIDAHQQFGNLGAMLTRHPHIEADRHMQRL